MSQVPESGIIAPLAKAKRRLDCDSWTLFWAAGMSTSAAAHPAVPPTFVATQTFPHRPILRSLQGALQDPPLPEFDVVWWCNASTWVCLINDLYALANRLQLLSKHPGPVYLQRMIPRLMEHLIETSEWLLVLDNAPNPNVLQDLLPPRSGYTVITSQYTGYLEGSLSDAKVIPVEPAGIDHAPLLWDAARGDAEIMKIAERLGNRPVALRLAAAYCKRHEVGATRYCDLLERSRGYQLQVCGCHHCTLHCTAHRTSVDTQLSVHATNNQCCAESTTEYLETTANISQLVVS